MGQHTSFAGDVMMLAETENHVLCSSLQTGWVLLEERGSGEIDDAIDIRHQAQKFYPARRGIGIRGVGIVEGASANSATEGSKHTG